MRHEGAGHRNPVPLDDRCVAFDLEVWERITGYKHISIEALVPSLECDVITVCLHDRYCTMPSSVKCQELYCKQELWLSDIEYFVTAANIEDALRRRFGNGVEWYTSMRHILDSKIDDVVSLSRDALPQNRAAELPSTPRGRQLDPPLTPTDMPPRRRSSPEGTPPLDSSPPASPAKHRRQASPSRSRSPSPTPAAPPQAATNPFPPPEDETRPSDYLRDRCPACFGGKWEDPEMILSIIVSGDACFTQRRNKGRGGCDP
ncbi:hypothetical protein C8R45DRAFT_1105826, partial [Mycena sanguinolenta]